MMLSTSLYLIDQEKNYNAYLRCIKPWQRYTGSLFLCNLINLYNFIFIPAINSGCIKLNQQVSQKYKKVFLQMFLTHSSYISADIQKKYDNFDFLSHFFCIETGVTFSSSSLIWKLNSENVKVHFQPEEQSSLLNICV